MVCHKWLFGNLIATMQTGLYTWMGGPTLGSINDATIMRNNGPPEEKMINGEIVLMDGAFKGIQHVITPWRKPRKKDMPGRWIEYNKGHSYIRARGVTCALFCGGQKLCLDKRQRLDVAQWLNLRLRIVVLCVGYFLR